MSNSIIIILEDRNVVTVSNLDGIRFSNREPYLLGVGAVYGIIWGDKFFESYEMYPLFYGNGLVK